MLIKARLDHVQAIHQLLLRYAKEGVLLPRSMSNLCDHVRDFFVWEEDGKVLGCGALHITWIDLGEIRSLAVDPSAQGRGIATQIVARCLEEARELRIPRVFTLTFVPGFFEKRGFRRVKKEALPHKIWAECVNCPHFPDCNEVPLVMDLDPNAGAALSAAPSPGNGEA